MKEIIYKMIKWFSPASNNSYLDSYLDFEQWAILNGYNLKDQEQRLNAILAYRKIGWKK